MSKKIGVVASECWFHEQSECRFPSLTGRDKCKPAKACKCDFGLEMYKWSLCYDVDDCMSRYVPKSSFQMGFEAEEKEEEY